MKVAFLGATKGMGRALARLMSQRGDHLFLLGRDADDLAAQRARPRGAGRAPVSSAPCDLERPESFAPALDAAETALGGLDAVVVTAGLFATQDQLEADPALTHRLLLRRLHEYRRLLRGGPAPPPRPRRRHVVRIQLRGRGARAQAGGPLRSGQGRA